MGSFNVVLFLNFTEIQVEINKYWQKTKIKLLFAKTVKNVLFVEHLHSKFRKNANTSRAQKCVSPIQQIQYGYQKTN
jgi:hypothetical protein